MQRKLQRLHQHQRSSPQLRNPAIAGGANANPYAFINTGANGIGNTHTDANSGSHTHPAADAHAAAHLYASPTNTPTLPSVFEEFENGPWLENQHPRLAATISGLDWVKDHIDDTESRVVQDLIYIASSSAQAAETVVALAWFQDNVSDGEKELVKSIRSIAYHDAGAAERIAGMPFLKTPGPADREALASLAKLARFEPSTFDYVMAYHSAENGITDKETMTIAMVYGDSQSRRRTGV